MRPHREAVTDLGNKPSTDSERRLLGEISSLAERVRGLRSANAVRNDAQIKALTAQLRSKWDDMRALRAPSVNGDTYSRGRGGLYG